jgi:hypothetical protein
LIRLRLSAEKRFLPFFRKRFITSNEFSLVDNFDFGREHVVGDAMIPLDTDKAPPDALDVMLNGSFGRSIYQSPVTSHQPRGSTFHPFQVGIIHLPIPFSSFANKGRNVMDVPQRRCSDGLPVLKIRLVD